MVRVRLFSMVFGLTVGSIPCSVTPTSAEPYVGSYRNGHSLLQDCSAANENISVWCTQYIGGVIDTLIYMQLNGKYNTCTNLNDLNVKRFTGQIREKVKNYIYLHRDLRDSSAVDLITQALREMFSCR